MSSLELDPGDCVIGHAEVFRILTADGGMRDEVRTDDGSGDTLDLPTAIGMLAIAQHTLLFEETP